MRDLVRRVIREILPPIVLRAVRSTPRTAIEFSGNYPRWADARAASTGYDTDTILARVEAATSRVASGEAACERDSLTFDTIEYSFPVLTGLLRAGIENAGDLTVLDFGGSLGSSFRQCQGYLSVLHRLEWRIVEQEHFVRRGRERFETDQLRFYSSIQAAIATGAPDVVLISSALQYLEDPYETLKQLCDTGSHYLIIDRTPFADISSDQLVVQHVPESIYPASYPCWIFSRERLAGALDAAWETLADFKSDDGIAMAAGTRFEFGGMIMRRVD